MPILSVKNKYDGTLVVRYHGRPCGNNYDCTGEPKLKENSLYVVDCIHVYPCDTVFYLRGFYGTYNSVCFEEVGVLDGTSSTSVVMM